MKLKQLREALRAITEEMTTLNDSIVSEKGEVRAFSKEEQERFDELEARAVSIRSAIQRAEKLEEQNAEVRRLSSAKDEVEIKTIREEYHNEKGEFRGFRSLGDQLNAVYRAEKGELDPRLKQFRAAEGLNYTVGSDGGDLIQSDFMAELTTETVQSTTIASLCRVYPISSNSNSVEIPQVDETSRADGSRAGGVQGYWTSEAGTITKSAPSFRTDRLTLEKLTALCYVTDEMLSDAAFLSSWVSQNYQEEMRFKLDAAIIEGDGAGKPLGIKNSAGLLTVTKFGSQAADTVVAQNIVRMWSRLHPASKSRAVWLINYEVEEQLPLMTIGDQPVYMPPGGLTGNSYGTLMGRPVIVAEACEKLGDAGDIYLGDFSRYVLAQKGSVEGAASIHVKFETAQMAFRFIKRVNGQPLDKSALTPYKGNSNQKLARFVTIEARS